MPKPKKKQKVTFTDCWTMFTIWYEFVYETQSSGKLVELKSNQIKMTTARELLLDMGKVKLNFYDSMISENISN